MSDVISLANQIAAEKENIRQAIENRGVSIPVTTPLTDYAAKIAAIDTENSASDLYIKDPNFDPATVDLVIPGNYGVIADGAFENNTNLETIDFQYVNTICDYAFENNTALTTITANHLKYIGDDAFKGTTNLPSFSNTHIKWIGANAFEHSGIASVNVPNCEIVRSGAFMEADSLETVNINSAHNIPAECFYGCNILNSVSANLAKNIGPYAFYQAGNGAYTTYGTTYSLSFPEVESIGMYAFYDANGLVSISLPKCKSLSSYSFFGCNNLATVNAPKVTNVEFYTFNDTNAIYNLNLPECLAIGNYNFFDNSHRITELTVADGCTIGDNCFKNGINKINGKISKIGKNVYHNLNYSTTIDMDFSEITSIGDYSFSVNSSSYTINITSQMIDLANCTKIGTSNTQGYQSVFTNTANAGAAGKNNVKKIWLRKDCVFVANNSITFSMFNQASCHIYTDAESKPAGWSNICTSATWHFGATHEEFEEA